MSSDNLTLQVACVPGDLGSGEEWETWSINLTISAGALRCTFTIEEPYLHSLAEWRGLAEGKYVHLDLNQGSGDWSIRVSEGIAEFRVMTSKVGGNASSVIGVPLAVIASTLTTALDRAVASGFQFRR